MAPSGLYRVEALSDFRSALLSFRRNTVDVADLVARQLDSIERRLNDVRVVAESRRTEAIERLRYIDEDDDVSEAEEKLKAAEDALEVSISLSFRFDRARVQAQTALLRWHSTTDRMVSHAALFLERATNDASEYLAVSLPGHRINSVVPEVGTIDASYSSGGGPGSWRAPSEATTVNELPPLPNGFEWLRIDGMPDSELPGSDDPPKGVPEQLMRASIERLWNEVLPLLGGTPDETRERCRNFDIENDRVDRRGFVHKESVLAVWEAFFNTQSSAQIRGEAARNGGRISITNGRHRIKVAKELGWRFIPAQIIRHG